MIGQKTTLEVTISTNIFCFLFIRNLAPWGEKTTSAGKISLEGRTLLADISAAL